MRVARIQTGLGNGVVECGVCERRCRIKPGGSGICGNYVNVDGKLYHFGYGRLSAVESRPIEIKPLFHYWPNSTALTFSNWGCNFYCPWCQNYHLSFRRPSESDEVVPPERLVELARARGDEGFSASFNEPTTNFDYVADLAELAVKEGFYFMMVTNGYLTRAALKLLLDLGVDGWSIDLKGCPGMRVLRGVDHEKVLKNARLVIEEGGHVEIVYLVVTGVNDSEECIDWVLSRHLDVLGPSVPLHVNRYFPAYAWREPPTPLEKLLGVKRKAERLGLEYVYVGNLHDPELETTYCSKCRRPLIRREGYRVTYFKLSRENGKYKCPYCGHEIPIRGSYVPGKTLLWL
ncbi:radical SAM protein [Infirmifilum lucidum]|uniref:Radical SAM protein n=1 Tax=Infirmifilum lucidum TaxID=2776706 RepID=A0A7L9FIT1_9CREN|nr:radical SAM protein [Infirmifilum lucidum]QOJ78695.1 radical SAM protein [Infirmifilum lucidum]